MQPSSLLRFLLTQYPGLQAVSTWGETALFYNPEMKLKRGVYFATIKEQDGPNDQASDLQREGIHRLNLGLPKHLYQEHFGPTPPRPKKGQKVNTGHDFSAIGILLPHPVYAWMAWVSILCPEESDLAILQSLLDAAYDKAQHSFEKRASSLPFP